MKLKQIPLLLCLLATILLHSCKDDEDNTPPNENGYAFDLTVTKEGNNIKLDWESLKVSSFVQYVIVRSLDSIPDDPAPSFNQQSANAFFIDDQNETTFTDISFPEFGDLYYKVYIQLDGRFVLSPTVKIPSDSKVLPFCYNHGAIIPGTNFIIITGGNNQVAKYDFVQHKVLKQRTVNLDNNVMVRVGDAGNGMEIFLFTPSSVGSSSERFLILDINSLSTKEDKDTGDEIYDILPSKKGFIFLTTDDFTYTIKSLKRSDLSVVGELKVQPSYVARRLLMTPSNPNRILELSSSEITAHNFNDNGEFIDFETLTIFPNSNVNRDIAVSSTGDAFIHTQDLLIRSVADLTELENYFFFTSSTIFDSQNDNFIYFSDFSSLLKLDRSNGELELITSLTLEVNQLFDNGDEVVLVGDAFNNLGCSFISAVDK